jgi:hypothetical protein
MSSVQEFDSSHSSLFSAVTLNAAAGREIYDLGVQLPGSVYRDSLAARGDFITATGPISDVLKRTDVATSLAALRLGSQVGVTIEGLPTDPELPPAPLDGGFPTGKSTLVSEGLAIAMARILGYPSIILGEKNEALIHQITPVTGFEATQSNAGQVNLRLHQDLAPNPDLPTMPYHLAMPDWLILTGVQAGSSTTHTYMASIEEALQHVSPRTRSVLAEKRFVTNPPDSFLQAMPDAANNLPSHAVLIEHEGHIESSFDTGSEVRPIDGPNDHEASSSLAELEYNGRPNLHRPIRPLLPV